MLSSAASLVLLMARAAGRRAMINHVTVVMVPYHLAPAVGSEFCVPYSLFGAIAAQLSYCMVFS